MNPKPKTESEVAGRVGKGLDYEVWRPWFVEPSKGCLHHEKEER